MTPEQIKALTEELTKQAEKTRQISSSVNAYAKAMEDYKKTLTEINRLKKAEEKLTKNIASGAAEDNEENRIKLVILGKQKEELIKQGNIMSGALKNVNAKSLVGAKMMGDAAKSMGAEFMKLPGYVQQAYGKLKTIGLFDMDKAMKQSALSMGVLTKQSAGFRVAIKSASFETDKVGIGIEKISKMQSDYSEELGRSVQLSSDGLIAMGHIAAATSLGVDGAAKLTAEFDQQGLSAERTGGFIEQTMNDAHAMGLNASKVVKNIANNTKMLNRYNFKGGVDGLAKMAKTVAKLGVGMEFAAGFADKLWSVEGAVDMSAQLSVMGGEWAKMADPFHLMHMARNDMEGLTKELGNAAAASAHFNSKGEIQIGAKEMHKLKIIAEQTGASYDELVTAGKNAFKLKNIGGQMFAGASDDEREFVANMAEMKGGKATVMIGSSPKLISQLDKGMVQALMKEKESLEERALNARTFDDALTNTINGMKQFLLPIIEVMNAKLIPKLDGFLKRFKDEGWGEKIEKFATTVAEFVTGIGGWIIDNPLKSGAILLGSMLADKAAWLLNGVMLATGFNGMAKIGGGVGGSSMIAGKAGLLKGGLYGAAGAGVGALTDWGSQKAKDSGNESLGKNIGVAGKAGEYALYGAALGSIFPPIGVPIGAGVGAIAGAGMGLYQQYGDNIGKGVNDGLFTSPINDGVIGGAFGGPMGGGVGNLLGSDFSKGRGIVQGGKITPIDNKDDLLAMKPGGVVDKSVGNQGSTTVKHTFGSINLSGEIKLVLPGGGATAVDLMKDPQFIREITKSIQSQLEKNINGGKNKG